MKKEEMMGEDNSGKSWMTYLRLITPFTVIVLTFIGWSVNMRICEISTNLERIDEKLFLHLTNAEIHTPRPLLVSQDAFTLYQTMRDKQLTEIKEMIMELKNILKNDSTRAQKK